MASQSLPARLQALLDSYKQTLTFIQRLQNIPTEADASSGESDPRIELAAEIHQSLKEQEDALELLKQEVDDQATNGGSGNNRWVGGGSVTQRRESEREQERDKAAATVAMLGEDLKLARASFRRAQLQAKRNHDAAKRKERELLFSSRSIDTETIAPARRKGQEKLTQDELAINASNDVTASLRRTHTLLQGSLQQSEFAQQTLDESSSALASLSENYSGLGDLLKTSRGLVGQLMRSQKSDTWYLETAFYLLVVTICWLVFRRILYGPFWWLVWQPLKLLYWLSTVALASIGIFGDVQENITTGKNTVNLSTPTGSFNSRGIPTFQTGVAAPYMPLPAKGGGWGHARPQASPSPSPSPAKKPESLLDEIGKMAENNRRHAENEETNIEDFSEEEMKRQEELPRNPKKRMFEKEKEDKRRDEL